MVRWLLLLVGGAVLITMFLVPMIYHRYDDHGVGEYYGIIHGRVFGYDPTTYLEVSGESSTSWRWVPPDTYIYESLDVTILTADGTELRGRLRIPEMVLTTGGKTESMSKQSFAALLLGANPSVESTKTANEIFEFFRTAGTGDFPAPRHHYYSLGDDENQIGGNVAHWSMGKRIPHLLICWIIVWFVLCVRATFRLEKTNGEPSSHGAAIADTNSTNSD